MRATLVVALIEFHQTFIDVQTVEIMKKADHLLHIDSLVGRVSGYLFKKYLMNIN
jgi:hypothetical protein